MTHAEHHEFDFPDLAYAVSKGGDDITGGPITVTDEPGGDAMRWTGVER